MRKSLVLVLLSFPAAGVDILPAAEIKSGMKGYGLSVFQGTEPERFGFEVIDVLRNIYPGQDMVLCRIEHPVVEKAGIISGMSGSPLYVLTEGREMLLGALAYGWCFSKEPIAGITPAEQMQKAPPVQATGEPKAAALLPLSVPMVVAGASPRTVALLRQLLEPHGIMPVEGGAEGREGEKLGRSLKPGDAVGIRLLGGDMDWSAIGTVTWLEGETVYAFGHPFMLAGPIRLPLTAAKVHAVIPSMYSSFKVSSALETVGMLELDYLSSIRGRLGALARMIPLEVACALKGAGTKTYRYEVAPSRSWLPLISALAVEDSLDKALPYSGNDCAVEYAVTITLAGSQAHTLKDRLVARDSSAAAFRLYMELWTILDDENQPVEAEKIEKVKVETTLEPGNFSAQIIRARGPNRVLSGERFAVEVDVRPFGKPPDALVTTPVEVSAPLVRSRRMLAIAIAPASDLRPPLPSPRSAAEYLELAARFERPEVLRAVVQEDAFYGAVGEKSTLRMLPASAASALDRMEAFFTEGRAFEARTDYILEGSATLSVEVEPR